MAIPSTSQDFLDGSKVNAHWRRWLEQLDKPKSVSELQERIAEIQAQLNEIGEGGVQIVGLYSIQSSGDDGTYYLSLMNDQADTPATYMYGTDASGLRGWWPVEQAFAVALGELTKSVDPDTGVITFGLADVPDAGGGEIRKFDRDAKGRVSGTSSATTDDLDEGSSNLYFTDERADARITLQKGQPGGLATLDGSGKLDGGQLPALAITETFVVADEAAMLALTAQQGDVAVRTDEQKSYILTADPASTLGNWQELLTPTGTGGTVTSVALSVPTGLTVSGSPITSSGTITVNYDTGYQGYTSAEASKLSGIATGATVGADWNVNLSNIPTNIASWAGISPASKADASALAGYLPLTGGTLSGNLVVDTANNASIVGRASGVQSGQIRFAAAGTVLSGANSFVALRPKGDGDTTNQLLITETSASIGGVPILLGADSGWISASLQNSWSSLGGSFGSPAYRRVGNRVWLRGVVQGGSTINNTTVFSLPAGYRPAVDVIFPAASSSSLPTARITVKSGGSVQFRDVNDNSFLSFANVTFLTD